jgi:hypothetical protein
VSDSIFCIQDLGYTQYSDMENLILLGGGGSIKNRRGDKYGIVNFFFFFFFFWNSVRLEFFVTAS